MEHLTGKECEKMSPFLLVLNIISAIILVAYIAYGIIKKKRIKAAKAAEENKQKRNV